jgi:hypothetical protein
MDDSKFFTVNAAAKPVLLSRALVPGQDQAFEFERCGLYGWLRRWKLPEAGHERY